MNLTRRSQAFSEQPDNLTLTYSSPATRWFEALPLGNGRIGAMVYGGRRERIEITEATCWSGEASAENAPEGVVDIVSEVRQLLFAGKHADAEHLAEQLTGKKLNFGSNIPFGTLNIDFTEPMDDYLRVLDLDIATAIVHYRQGDTTYTRTIFVSHPHQVLVANIGANCPNAVSCAITIDGANNAFEVSVDEQGDLVLTGRARETIHSDGLSGVGLHARVRVIADGGSVIADDGRIDVHDAGSALLIVSLNTTFCSEDPAKKCLDQVESAARLSYDELLADHIADHQRLFHRVALDLGETPAADLTIDQRLAAARDGADDPALIALMFQYGRYLLMSSSREDSLLPTHLQGIWNDNEACRIGWSCDMHLDINTQMNYWPVEVTNLSDCFAPLARWINDALVPSGRLTASKVYGARGWVAHTVSNAWGYSAPGFEVHWGFNVTGGAWIAMLLWDHFSFTGDVDFLRDCAYPVLRACAEFFLDFLVEDPVTGYLVTAPSNAPENAFKDDDGSFRFLCAGPTCDNVILRALFNACINAGELLGIGDDIRPDLESASRRLAPLKIGRHGQLQEWLHDYDEAMPNHRHTSHLLALFPFAEIIPDRTPEMARAARVAIERRMNAGCGWECSGWAASNMLLYEARLRDGDAAYARIRQILTELTEANLMVFHPPTAGAIRNVYELDGNTGFCSGVAEMLLQSHADEIHLLPALPSMWTSGKVRGLRARGGVEVSIEWESGVLTRAELRTSLAKSVRVRYGDRVEEVCLEACTPCVILSE